MNGQGHCPQCLARGPLEQHTSIRLDNGDPVTAGRIRQGLPHEVRAAHSPPPAAPRHLGCDTRDIKTSVPMGAGAPKETRIMSPKLGLHAIHNKNIHCRSAVVLY